jgi:predicted dehydrogenase
MNAMPGELLRGQPFAMVGGGPRSGVGELHLGAARAAGLRLVAGCFSRDPARNRAAGAALGLEAERVADTVQALVAGESARPGGARLLVICTPHVFHIEALSAAFAQGWRVVVEKPLCVSLEELNKLSEHLQTQGSQPPQAALPLVMRYMPGLVQLRADVAAGAIGSLRWMSLEYLQGREQHAGADWRFQRASAGPAGTLADLGPHAWDLCHWLSGEEPTLRAADIRTLDAAHELDDSAWVWLDLGAAARAQVTLCQAAVGQAADCTVRLFGVTGVLEWRLRNEAQAGGGVECLYRLAFEGFYADVARWHKGPSASSPSAMPTWLDGVRAVQLTDGCLKAARGQTINKVS